MKFTKKPVVIEAFQMTPEHRASNAEWLEWMHKAWQLDRETPGSLYPTEPGTGDGTLSIGTLEGQHLVSWGDWIIQGVKGELYPCKPDIFDATYSKAMLDCGVCGSGLVEIRSKYPGCERRWICACCLQERMDTLHEMFFPNCRQADATP